MGGYGDPGNAGFIAGSQARVNSQRNAATFDKGIAQAISYLESVSRIQPKNPAYPVEHVHHLARRTQEFPDRSGGGGGVSDSEPLRYSWFSPERYLQGENFGGAIRAGRDLKYSTGSKLLGCVVVSCVSLAVYFLSSIRHTRVDAIIIAIVSMFFGFFVPRMIGSLFAGTLTAAAYVIAYTLVGVTSLAALSAVQPLGSLSLPLSIKSHLSRTSLQALLPRQSL